MSEDPFRGLDSYRSPHEDEEREYAYQERAQKIEGQLRLDELEEPIDEEDECQ
jgi:DNA-binding FrmR family transcriptional regulator